MWILLLLQATLIIGYLAGNDALLPPLKAKDEAVYLEKMKNGDTKARNKLVEHNLRLVAHIARKYNGSTQWEPDDLISVGSIGLMKGLDTFDPDKKAKLSTYLARCIENEIRMLLRTEKKSRQDLSLQDAIGQDKEGNVLTFDDILEYDDTDFMESIDYKLDSERLRDAIRNHLDETQQQILMARYGLNGKAPAAQWQIAEELGISRSYVSRIEKKAIEILRKAMNA